MIQPVAKPLPRRAATSTGSVGASPHSATITAATAAAIAMQKYLPTRSAIGPITSCTEPCASRYTVTTIEVAPTVTLRSAAICGSSELVTRTMAWAAKPATAKSAMALVALPPVFDGFSGKS